MSEATCRTCGGSLDNRCQCWDCQRAGLLLGEDQVKALKAENERLISQRFLMRNEIKHHAKEARRIIGTEHNHQRRTEKLMSDYIKKGKRVLLVITEGQLGIVATLVDRPSHPDDTYIFRCEGGKLLEVQRFVSMYELEA